MKINQKRNRKLRLGLLAICAAAVAGAIALQMSGGHVRSAGPIPPGKLELLQWDAQQREAAKAEGTEPLTREQLSAVIGVLGTPIIAPGVAAGAGWISQWPSSQTY